MDLLVTVDTALAHLAGAMRIPTLLLLTFQPDWRLLLERNDTPWYPTLRLYSQPVPGDWDLVIRQLVEDLCGPDGEGPTAAEEVTASPSQLVPNTRSPASPRPGRM